MNMVMRMFSYLGSLTSDLAGTGQGAVDLTTLEGDG